MSEFRPSFNASAIPRPEAERFLKAAEDGDEAALGELLDRHGAGLLAEKRKFGMSALLLAASRGQERSVDLLLGRGADIEDKSSERWTPLMHAAYRGHESLIRLLLQRGAQLEARSKAGTTALMLAAASGQAAAVALLLETGADADAVSNNGLRAAEHAAKNSHDETAQLLAAHPAQRRARERAEIARAIDGGLKAAAPYPGPFRF